MVIVPRILFFILHKSYINKSVNTEKKRTPADFLLTFEREITKIIYMEQKQTQNLLKPREKHFKSANNEGIVTF